MTDTIKVAVAVLTFRRPECLRTALPVLIEQATEVNCGFQGLYQVEVIVVDNDPAGSGRPVVTETGSRLVRYVSEATPGIAAARNRAIETAHGADLLVFIDDDELASPGWLQLMLETKRLTGAAAVAGAVESDFDGVLDGWLSAGEFFTHRRMSTGTRITTAATNNLLLDLHVLKRLSLRFDVEFGLTGGEDTLLTRSLSAAGELIVWCDEAVVVDRIPVIRMTKRWVLRRALSSGNAEARVQLALAAGWASKWRRGVLLRMGLSRMILGGARWCAGTLIRSHYHQARGLRSMSRGTGMLMGTFGRVYFEYRR